MFQSSVDKDLPFNLLSAKDDSKHNGDNDQNDDNDTEAVPLLAAGSTSALDGLVGVSKTGLEVLLGVVGLGLDLGHNRLLLGNHELHVVEELSKLVQGSSNLLNVTVTVLDLVEGRLGLAASVGVQ